MLKILHTSDLHLGKKLFKVDRLAEQKAYLNWLVEICIIERIDILIIAGDIFDTPSPPHEAVSAYFDFLNKISEVANTQTMIIAGNHDSRAFIQAPNELLKKNNIFVWGELDEDPNNHRHEIIKGNQKYHFYALPYFRSYDFLKWHKAYFNELIPTDDDNKEDAFINVLKQFLKLDLGAKNIFIGHHLFGPYSLAGSEQAISLSGLDSIPISLFQDFDYMALGHIHKYQKVSNSISAYYSGSPYPLRFSEKQLKQVNIVSLDQNQTSIKALAIPQSRKLYDLNTTTQSLVKDIKNILKEESHGDFKNLMAITVAIDEPTSGLSDLARSVLKDSNTELIYLKNVLANEKEHFVPSNNNELTIEELFIEYYKTKFPDQDISKELLNEFHHLLKLKEGHEI